MGLVLRMLVLVGQPRRHPVQFFQAMAFNLDVQHVPVLVPPLAIAGLEDPESTQPDPERAVTSQQAPKPIDNVIVREPILNRDMGIGLPAPLPQMTIEDGLNCPISDELPQSRRENRHQASVLMRA